MTQVHLQFQGCAKKEGSLTVCTFKSKVIIYMDLGRIIVHRHRRPGTDVAGGGNSIDICSRR